MHHRMVAVYRRLAALLALILIGWFALADTFRQWETSACMLVVHAAAAAGLPVSNVIQVDSDAILLVPAGHNPIVAQVSRSCSVLSALLAATSLSLLVMGGSLTRRLKGLTASVLLLVAANTVRLAASVYLGARFGPVGLLLFHDLAGTLFVLGYTLAGFALLLRFHMPSSPSGSPTRRYGDLL